MTYAATIAAAERMIAAKGAAVTFVRSTAATYDPLTGGSAPTPETATGSAIARTPRGPDAERIKALDLVAVQTIVLLVAASALGTYVPTTQDRVLWAGAYYTARDVSPLNLNGSEPVLYTVIAAR